ncbi:MAG TPA: Flp family type IVb pilin [Dongiaceae bacterium]|nr:Flp family type IVb pilin [Dongiaceae bacterium]
MRFVKAFVSDRRGVTMIEYALIAALVFVACFTILATLGTTLTNFYYAKVNRALTTAA